LKISLQGRNGYAQIRFEDSGFGLEEEQLKRLFVPFNSSFKNGTGLGLPIVYQIVRAHNGAIAVRSKKGLGTTVIIDL
jgi:two-component system sporulation sensor kinase B